MQTIVHVIIATTTALLFPLTSATETYTVPEPEPSIQQPATTTNQVEVPAEEEKLIPEPLAKQTLSACNCYNILKEKHDSVPSMASLQQQAGPEIGNVAVFMYPPNEDWPTGIPHVASVLSTTTDGTILIEEYNYHQCQHTTREISPTDHRLIGFVNI